MLINRLKYNKKFFGTRIRYFTVFTVILSLSVANAISLVPLDLSKSIYIGAEIKFQEKIDTVPPVAEWTMDCDGTVTGTVTDMPNDSNFRSNLGQVNEHYTINYKLEVEKFTPGLSRSTNWKLLVIDKFRDAKASLSFVDFSGKPMTITINYSAPMIAIRPSQCSFGIMKKGEEAFKDFWIVNENKNFPIDLRNVVLNLKNQGFEILDLVIPDTIPPMDSIKFKILFKAERDGNYRDSIGIADTCIFGFRASLDAEIVSPIIDAKDVYFEDVIIGLGTSKEVIIYNHGKVDLMITGFSGPFNSAFTPKLKGMQNFREITTKNPLILPPDSSFLFIIDFQPDVEKSYIDSMVFYSDAHSIDSVLKITGKGIKRGLIANSYDWGRCRIDRSPKFPAGPYSSQSDKVITLRNRGNDTVQIYNIIEIPDNLRDVFIFPREAFDSLKIPPGGQEYIEVHFKPTEVGEYQLIIQYDDSKNSKTESRLRGIGIAPKIFTENVDFDTSVVEDYTSPYNQYITFTNVPWEYSDSLKITDFDILPLGSEISSTITHYGSEGFKFEKSSINLPITLQPGKSLQIPMFFVAQRIGEAKAMLKSVSDALSDTSSLLNGYGIVQGIKLASGATAVCLGKSDTILISIENYGSRKISVDSLHLIKQDSQLRFMNPIDTLGFILGEKETRDIKIIFSPINSGIINGKIQVFYSIQDDNSYFMEKEITAEAIFIERTLSVNIPDYYQNTIVGNTFSGSVMLNDGDDLEPAQITQIEAKINYNPDILKVIEDSIRTGGLLEGKFNPDSIYTDEENGIITLILKRESNEVLNGSGELFKFSFGTFTTAVNLNKNETQTEELIKELIKVKITPIENSCAIFSIDSANIDLRQIFVNNLLMIRPNPLTSDGGFIEFSIAEENFAEILIYNTLGSIVSKPLSKTLKAGSYIIAVPSERLSSGAYWCRLNAGKYSRSIKFMVLK